MKKLLTAFFALILSITCAFGLAACVDKGGNGGNTNNPGTTTTKSDAEIAKTAINNLKTLYNKESEKEHGSSYEVLGKTQVDGKLYEIVWTVSSESTEYNIHEYITVGEDIDPETLKVTIGVKKASVKLEYLLTATVTVNDAVESISFERTVPASAIDGDTVSAGIQFDATEKRTQFSNDIQVWEQNGIKVTNTKHNSSSNVGNFSNPARFYQGSKVKIEYPGMKYLVFDSVNYSDNPYADRLKASLEAYNIPAEITVNEEGDVTVKLDYAMDYIEFVANAQTRVYKIDIDAVVGGASDADKVATAKALLSLDKYVYSELNDYNLPSSSYGANLTWTVKAANDYVSVANNKLTVKSLPSAKTAVTLVAAIALGEAKDSAEVEIKVVAFPTLTHAGTADDPYTIAEVQAIADTLDKDAFYTVSGSTAEICVEGYVIKVGSWSESSSFANWTGNYIATSASSVTDSADALYVYRINLDGTYLKTSADLLKGAKIVVKGALQNFAGNTPEITNSGSISVVAVNYDASNIEPEPPIGDIELPETAFPVTSIPELKALVPSAGNTTTEKYYVIGAVKSVEDAYNSKIYIIDEDGNELYVYGLRNEDGSTVLQTPSTLFNVGDAIVVYGVMINFSGTIEMQYAWLVQIGETAKTDVARVLLAETVVASNATEDFELPTADGKITWAVTSGTGITIEEGSTIAKVTRTAEDQTVVLTATANVNGVTATKTYTVLVPLYVAGQELIVLTADNLLAGVSGYQASGNATIGGYAFSWIGMGNYGLLQMRTNASTGTSSFWNADAFGGSIIKVVLVWSASKDVPSGKTNNLKVEFANNVEFTNAKTELVTFTNEAKTVELTLSEEYTYVRVTHNNQGAVYIDEVKITFNAPSDESIVNSEKAKVEAAIAELKDLFKEVDDYVTLPTASKGVSIAWTVTSGTATLVGIAEGKLTIKALPESENATLVITGTLTLNDATATVTYTIEIVSASGDSRPDSEKVADALAEVELTKTTFTAVNEELALPAESGEVKLEWEVVDHKDLVQIVEGKLTVIALPTSDTEVTLKVTASKGTYSDDTTVTIIVKADAALKYGTAENPLSVTAALALAAEECVADNSFTKQAVYMKGTVTNVPTVKTGSSGDYYQNIYLADLTASNTTILVYSINLRSNVAAPAQNDTLLIYGYIKNNVYNSTKTIEFASNGSEYVYIEVNTRGTSTITLGEHEGATVTGLPETATNGTVVEFTVSVDSSKVIEAVKANGVEITEAEGKYSFTVNGNTTITIEVRDAEAKAPEVIYTLTQKTGGDNGYATASDITLDDGKVWNVEGNSGMNPWRFGGKNLTGVDRKLTGKNIISGKVTKMVITFGSINLTVNSVTLNVFKVDPTGSDAAPAYTANVACTANTTTTVMAGANEDWTDCYYQLVFNVTAGGSNSYVQFTALQFWGYADESAAATVSAPEALPAEYSKSKEY